MHICAGQIPVIAEEAKDPSHILGYAAIRGFEHQYMLWFYLNKLYLTSTNIHTHTRTHFGCKHHYKYFHTTMHCIKGRGSGNRNNNKGGYCNIHVLCLWNILIIRVLSQLLIHHLLTLPTYHCWCCWWCRGCRGTHSNARCTCETRFISPS